MHDLIPLVACTFVLGYTWPLQRQSGVFRLLWCAMLLGGIWSAQAVIRNNFYLEPEMFTVLLLAFFLAAAMTALLLHFAIRLNRQISRPELLLLYLLPAINLIMLPFEAQSDLLVHSFSFDQGTLHWQPGRLYPLHTLYINLQCAAAVGCLLLYLRRERLKLLPFVLLSGLLICYTLVVHLLMSAQVRADLTLHAFTALMMFAWYYIYLNGNHYAGHFSASADLSLSQKQSHFLAFNPRGELVDHSHHVGQLLVRREKGLTRLTFRDVDNHISYLPPFINGGQQRGYTWVDSRVYRIIKCPLPEGGNVVRFVDATIEYRLRQAREQISYTSQLTGLKNLKAARAELGSFESTKHKSAMAIIELTGDTDFEGFRRQARHDEYLRAAARRISQQAQELIACTVYQLSQNQLLLCTRESGDTRQLVVSLEQLLSQCSQPIQVSDQHCELPLMIGAAQSRADDHFDDLLQRAEHALHYTKSRPGIRLHLADARLDSRSMRASVIDADITMAMNSDAFIPWYARRSDIRTGRLSGVFTQLRWEHSQLGTVYPGEIISSLRRVNRLHELDLLSWKLALRDVRQWLDAGRINRSFKIALYYSYHSLLRPELTEQLSALAAHYRIPESMLEIEITKNALAANNEQVLRSLAHLSRFNLLLRVDSASLRSCYSAESCRQWNIRSIIIDKRLTSTLDSPGSAEQFITVLQTRGVQAQCDLIVDGLRDRHHGQALLKLDLPISYGISHGLQRASELLAGQPQTGATPHSAVACSAS